MVEVSVVRFHNPLSVSKREDIDKVGVHFYVMPTYPTGLLLCTQCLFPQESEVHKINTYMRQVV